MSKKHDPIIQAAIIQAAATLTETFWVANKPVERDRFPPSEYDIANKFSLMLDEVEEKFDAHLDKHKK